MPAAVCSPLVGRMSSLPWYYPQWRVAVVEEYVMTAVGEGYCDLDQQRTVAEEGAEAAAVAEVPSLEVPPLSSLGNDEKVAAVIEYWCSPWPWLSWWSCWQRKVAISSITRRRRRRIVIIAWR